MKFARYLTMGGIGIGIGVNAIGVRERLSTEHCLNHWMAYRIYLYEYLVLPVRVEGSASNVLKANLWAACGCGIVAADDRLEVHASQRGCFLRGRP